MAERTGVFFQNMSYAGFKIFECKYLFQQFPQISILLFLKYKTACKQNVPKLQAFL